jgi:hypothetical protein
MINDAGGSLWAITSYFNPAGYRSRIENYRVFRHRLAVPLVTVELSFNGTFELRPGDADVLIQISGRDVMWQKERLLNLALQHPPSTCRKIAWIDCDVIFADDDWVPRVVRALDAMALVHLFEERHDLPGPVALDRLPSWRAEPTSRSVVHRMAVGDASPEDLYMSDAPVARHTTAGLAWASPRDVLEKHGLYDAAILGSGDRAILCAALGHFDYGARALLMGTRRKEHYLAWARPFHATVQGRVGHIPGRIFHLWHGAVKDRQYQTRHRLLEQFDFDPFSDVAPDDSGCWRWNSGKPELHRLVREYFHSRGEDTDRS